MEFNNPNSWYQSQVDEKSARRPKYSSRDECVPFELGMRGVCGRDQVKRSWKTVVGHEMSVFLSLRGRM